MPRALNLLRSSPHYRREAFDEGLKANGFKVLHGVMRDRPCPDDVLVVWNRDGGYDEEAQRFERHGARVVVVENGYLGNGWNGGLWYAMALGQHAGAGQWFEGGPERWDRFGVDLAPWRTGSGETLILAQRGIGPPDVRSPHHWAESVQKRIGGRIRQHPGNSIPTVSLERDLKHVDQVVTWHSAGALTALMMGIPVWHAFDQWIGARAARPLSEWGGEPKRDDADRLAMFRRLSWAMWQLEEVKNGTAISHLLSH